METIADEPKRNEPVLRREGKRLWAEQNILQKTAQCDCRRMLQNLNQRVWVPENENM